MIENEEVFKTYNDTHMDWITGKIKQQAESKIRNINITEKNKAM